MGKSALEIFTENPRILSNDPIEKHLWDKVRHQATTHRERNPDVSLHQESRPLEIDIFTEYRLKNTRHITYPVTSKVETMFVSTASRNDVGDIEDLNPSQESALQELKFNYLGKDLSFQEWKQRVFIPLALQDANAVVINFPYNPRLPQSSPFETINDTEELGLEWKVIYSYLIKYRDENIISWYGGVTKVKKKDYPFYYVLDDDAFWLAMPYLDDDDGLSWKLEVWYTHGLGFVPYVEAPGKLTSYTYDKSEKQESKRISDMRNRLDSMGYEYQTIFYKETFLFGCYEWLDQASVDFSNSQVARLRNSSSITVFNGEMECPTCSGMAQVPVAGFGREFEKCGDCNGTGKTTNLGQFSVIKTKQSVGEKGSSKPVDFAQPPSENTELAETFWEKDLDHAEKAVCLDPLEGKPNESGVAKDLRLQLKYALIKDFMDLFIDSCERIIRIELGMRGLDYNVSLKRPSGYKVKTIETLREEMKNCLPMDRRERYLEIKRIEHSNDPIKIKKYEIITKICPLILYTLEEQREEFAQGAITEDDIIKKRYCECALTEIIEDRGTELSVKEYIEAIEKWMLDNGIIEPVISIQGEEILGGGEKEIANTVGGVTGIVNISRAVAAGEMTEKAAENILMTVYGYNRDQAAGLIDIPKVNNQDEEIETTQTN